MTGFIYRLINDGYTSIKLLENNYYEERSGYQNEHVDISVIAIDSNGECFRVNLKYVQETMKPRVPRLPSYTPISRDEFDRLGHGKSVIDTPAYLQKKKRYDDKQQKDKAAARSLDEKIKRGTPKCPKCDETMEVMYNRRSGNRFWGCKRYRTYGCKGTRNVSVAMNTLLDQRGKYVLLDWD